MRIVGTCESFWHVEPGRPVVRRCSCGRIFVPAPGVGRDDECALCHVTFRRIIKAVNG
jgi:hypothetical protein